MKLWYTREAGEWTQALPIGNGHLGAMCYGGAPGRFDLSENTCWSGESQPCPLDENAGERMRSARDCLLAGEYGQADLLLEGCTGIKGNYGTQVPLGRLTAALAAAPVSVRRELELETGLALDVLALGGGQVRRESFASNPDKVLAVRMTAQGERQTFRLWVEGWSQPCRTDWDAKAGTLAVTGRALENIHSDGLTGVSYCIRLHYETDGSVSWNRRGLVIENASVLTVILTAATDFFGDEPARLCRRRLENALSKGYDAVRADHLAEHTEAMNRCAFTMPDERGDLPTDERIRAYAKNGGGDGGLIALFFQYGRYLLFSSSRPDSVLPAALQGVWNDDRACRMEWTDDMHLDINTQMNYCPAEKTGLGSCAAPLFRWMRDVLAPNGAKIAKALYGAGGWCAHTVSNAFGWAAPGWDVPWGFGVSCGGWLALSIWEHYQYTRDRGFLAAYYDTLRESARFLRDILMEAPGTGELVTVPSYSPENAFLWERTPHCLAAGGTFDTAAARAVFQAVRKAAELLGREDDFTRSLAEALDRLPPFRVGKHGQLMEWYRDFEEAYPDHRHMSHLLSLHPFGLLSPDRDPALCEAVRTTLRRRLGDNAKDIVYANWAGALLILFSARLREREKAGNFVRPMIAFLSRENMMIAHQGPTTSITGGIYELDGNTGFTAGVAEMLLQDGEEGELLLLPAVPGEWKSGSFSGLRAHGGLIVSASWDESAVSGSVLSPRGAALTLRAFGQEQRLTVSAGEPAYYRFCRAENAEKQSEGPGAKETS